MTRSRPDELAALVRALRAQAVYALRAGRFRRQRQHGADGAVADWLRQHGADAALHTVLTVDHGLRARVGRRGASRGRAGRQRSGFAHATLVWEGPKPQTGMQAAARQRALPPDGRLTCAPTASRCFSPGTRATIRPRRLLMRLARGSGLDGLAGMAPRLHFSDLGLGDPGWTQHEIARPLLDVPRARLRATLQARGIAWIEDPSNQSPEFERPRLRAARAHLDEPGTDGRHAGPQRDTAAARTSCTRPCRRRVLQPGRRRGRSRSVRLRHDRSGPIAGVPRRKSRCGCWGAPLPQPAAATSRSRWPSSRRLSHRCSGQRAPERPSGPWRGP